MERDHQQDKVRKYLTIFFFWLFFQLLTDNTNNLFCCERYETLAAADKERYKNDMKIYEVKFASIYFSLSKSLDCLIDS